MKAQTLSSTIAGEIRAEMGRQLKTKAELAEVLDLGIRAAQHRYNGGVEYSLDEVDAVAEWLGVPREQLTTGRRVAVA